MHELDEEVMIVGSLLRQGKSKFEIVEACKDESLGLDIEKVKKYIEGFDPSISSIGDNPKTAKLRELFQGGTYAKFEIIEKLRNENLVGRSLLGRLQAEIMIRRGHSLNLGGPDRFYFTKKEAGKYSFDEYSLEN